MKIDFEKPEYDFKNDLLIFKLSIKPIYYKKTIILKRMIVDSI